MDLEQIRAVGGLSYELIEKLITYKELTIFLGAFFFAESVILTVSFLSAQGFWSVPTVFVFTLLGELLSTFFWYFGGVYLLQKTRQWSFYKKLIDEIAVPLDKITKGKPFLALLFIQFLYGTRFLMIIYISLKKIPFKKFFLYGTAGIALWLSVVISIGWLAGKGFYNIIPIYKNINYAIFILVLSFIIFKIIGWWMRKKLLKHKKLH